jgi:hypothetical protein
MPGDHRINFRAQKKDIELIQQAAALTKRSMVNFGMSVMLHAAKNVLAGETGKVQASPVAPAGPASGQKVSEKLHSDPSEDRELGPDEQPHPNHRLHQLSEQHIRIWLSQIVKANQEKEQERLERLEREAADDLW